MSPFKAPVLGGLSPGGGAVLRGCEVEVEQAIFVDCAIFVFPELLGSGSGPWQP